MHSHTGIQVKQIDCPPCIEDINTWRALITFVGKNIYNSLI